MLRSELAGLYNAFHRENLESYLELGVLSFDRAQQVPHRSVADPAVQTTRDGKIVPGTGRRLHSYANLYVNSRNIVGYRFIEDTIDDGGSVDDICVIRVSPEVLDLPGVIVTDRNAASWPQWLPPDEGIAQLDRAEVFAKYWSGKDHAQKMCAEVLIPDVVPPAFIEEVLVCSSAARQAALPLCGEKPVTVKPWWFFR